MNNRLIFVMLIASFCLIFLALRSHYVGVLSGFSFKVDDELRRVSGNYRSGVSSTQNADEIRTVSASKLAESLRLDEPYRHSKLTKAQGSVLESQVVLDGNLYKWSARSGEVPIIRKVSASGDESNAVEWVADSFIITSRGPESAEKILAELGPAGVRAVHSLGAARKLWKVTIAPRDIEDFFVIFQKVGSSQIVESSERNFVLKTAMFSNDPLLSIQYSMARAGTSAFVRSRNGSHFIYRSNKAGYSLTKQNAEANLQADSAWGIKRDCSSIKVGVLDSGVDRSHPDLVSNLDLDLSRNFVSDAVLADDCTQKRLSIPIGGSSSVVPSEFMDENGHGTHVVGTIGGVGDNNIGVSGVCWKARIIALRAMNRCGRGTSDAMLAAIEFASQKKVRILNMSLGGSTDAEDISPGSLTYKKIEEFADSGGLIIAAAGNSNSDNSLNPFIPASINHPALVSVASHNAANAISGYSNYSNTNVHVAAPGEAILSTIPLALNSSAASFFKTNARTLNASAKFKEAAISFPEKGYDFRDGTSMASPHVAGVAALAWSMDPSKSNLEVKNLILHTADKVPGFANKVVSGRRINLLRAIKAAEGLAMTFSRSPASPIYASVSSGEPVYVQVNDVQARALEGGRLYLDSEEIGDCSSFDRTCVGKVPLSLSSEKSLDLSIKSGTESLAVASVRVIGLSVANGLFTPNEARFSCRVSIERKTIASFKAASFGACKNLCRMLVPVQLSGSGQCSFGDQTESVPTEACRAEK